MTDHTTFKTCTQCGKSLPATPEYFTRTKSTKDGLYTKCKKCKQSNDRNRWTENADELNAKRRETYPDRAESRKEYGKKWHEKNREEQRAKKKANYWANRDDNLAKSKAWREANPEYRKQKGREYAQKNRQRIQQRQRKWETDNRERLNEQRRPQRRINQQTRESRKANLPTAFTQADWDRAVEYFGGGCAVCGRQPGFFHGLALDHWIPLSSPDCPGTIPTNIVPLCHGFGGCNNSKHKKDALAWLKKKFGEKKGKSIAAKIQRYFDSLKAD